MENVKREIGEASGDAEAAGSVGCVGFRVELFLGRGIFGAFRREDEVQRGQPEEALDTGNGQAGKPEGRRLNVAVDHHVDRERAGSDSARRSAGGCVGRVSSSVEIEDSRNGVVVGSSRS